MLHPQEIITVLKHNSQNQLLKSCKSSSPNLVVTNKTSFGPLTLHYNPKRSISTALLGSEADTIN
jgi:hypothetical protein